MNQLAELAAIQKKYPAGLILWSLLHPPTTMNTAVYRLHVRYDTILSRTVNGCLNRNVYLKLRLAGIASNSAMFPSPCITALHSFRHESAGLVWTPQGSVISSKPYLVVYVNEWPGVDFRLWVFNGHQFTLVPVVTCHVC